jgi:GntR family transcriptional regulator
MYVNLLARRNRDLLYDTSHTVTGKEHGKLRDSGSERTVKRDKAGSMDDLRLARRPLVAEVHDRLLDLLKTGGYVRGDRLPSETELATRFGVNRSTVREALRILQEEHLIVTRHGTGRFVAPNPSGVLSGDITHLRSVTEMAGELGIPIGTQVLALREENPEESARTALELGPDDRVAVLERVRLANECPVIYSVDVFPMWLVTGELSAEQFSGSLVAIMEERWNTQLAYSRAMISAVMLDPKLSRRIQVPDGAPWILLEQINYDERDVPILYSKDYHHSDYFRFSVLRRRKRAT